MTAFKDDDPWRGLNFASDRKDETAHHRKGDADLHRSGTVITTMKVPLPITESRFKIPRLRPGTVDRRMLYARMGAAATKAITVVSSPPVFGKTTMVLGWLMASPSRRPATWLSLDDEASDPTGFIADLATAVRVLCPGFGTGVRDMAKSVRPVPPAALLREFCIGLQRIDVPVTVVIDDFHRGGPAIEAVVAKLVDELHGALRLVILTRSEPGLPLARWRACGELMEIDQADLEFTSAEVRRFSPPRWA